MNKIIIWDWNGTLLDDIDVVIDVMNGLLSKRNLPLLTRERYRNVFTFPIINYYKKLGFDFGKEKFEDLAIEFIEKYLVSYHRFKLYKGAEKTLACLKEEGYRQIILSATNKANLNEQIEIFGLQKYFSDIIGVDDHFGKSKKDHGLEIIRKLEKGHKATMIGDTLHDLEVAQAIGSKCILISHGHQDKAVLSGAKAEIVGELKDVLEYV
jgi:phosphoglycolate phosphatase